MQPADLSSLSLVALLALAALVSLGRVGLIDKFNGSMPTREGMGDGVDSWVFLVRIWDIVVLEEFVSAFSAREVVRGHRV